VVVGGLVVGAFVGGVVVGGGVATGLDPPIEWLVVVVGVEVVVVET
jgi:hypothetical protein